MSQTRLHAISSVKIAMIVKELSIAIAYIALTVLWVTMTMIVVDFYFSYKDRQTTGIQNYYVNYNQQGKGGENE